MTYVNSTFFTILLPPFLLQRLLDSNGTWRHLLRRRPTETKYALLVETESNTSTKVGGDDNSAVLDGHINDGPNTNDGTDNTGPIERAVVKAVEDRLTIRDTAWLSLEFSILWVRNKIRIYV